MEAVILFWIGWTAGYLISCQEKGKDPSWLYGVGSFWFFSFFWGDGMLWGSAVCLLFWILSWFPRFQTWIVMWRWRGGDDDDNGGDDPHMLPGDQGGGMVLKRVVREDDPWSNPSAESPSSPPIRPPSMDPLPKVPRSVPGYST